MVCPVVPGSFRCSTRIRTGSRVGLAGVVRDAAHSIHPWGLDRRIPATDFPGQAYPATGTWLVACFGRNTGLQEFGLAELSGGQHALLPQKTTNPQVACEDTEPA